MSRNKFLKFGLLAVMAVIVARLFFIQILQHDYWTERAAAQHTLQYTLRAERGEIYMLDGDEPVAVAMNATVYTVIVDPMMASRDEIQSKMTEILGDKRIAEWDDVFADKSRRYYIVGKNVERKAAEKVAEAEFDGVWLQANTKRVYPEGDLAGTLLGFVNAEGVGQYGIEGALNEQLTGKDGLLKTVKDVNNVALSIGDDNVKVPAEDGDDVVLTIDRNLQYGVEKIINEQIKQLGYKNISALVMNPNNGEILAMANMPGYDPGDFGNVESAADYVNHVVEDPYEPASVCKTFAFATGMEYGVMTANSTFNNENVTYVDNWPIKNSTQKTELLGVVDMQTALNWSLNTGSTQVLRWLGGSETEINALGRERLYEYYYDHFGLGKATGVELYESVGLVYGPHADIYGIDSTYANMTFGQNMQVTMLQVAAAFSSVINGGEFYTPTVVKGKLENGEITGITPRKAVRRTVTQETSAAMREMLYNTRRSWRTNGLDAAGYYVGGKTGTAQVIKDGEYSFDETVATYIGFGGTEGELPAYVIMVRVWEDGKTAGGEAQALPVFNVLKTYVQDYLKIEPAGN
jgi:cell division protein FtsI/penicillin-binding protein 2